MLGETYVASLAVADDNHGGAKSCYMLSLVDRVHPPPEFENGNALYFERLAPRERLLLDRPDEKAPEQFRCPLETQFIVRATGRLHTKGFEKKRLVVSIDGDGFVQRPGASIVIHRVSNTLRHSPQEHRALTNLFSLTVRSRVETIRVNPTKGSVNTGISGGKFLKRVLEIFSQVLEAVLEKAVLIELSKSFGYSQVAGSNGWSRYMSRRDSRLASVATRLRSATRKSVCDSSYNVKKRFVGAGPLSDGPTVLR